MARATPEETEKIVTLTGAVLQMDALLSQEGPFTNVNVDKPVMDVLMAWIKADPMRLRELLNYVHERGIIHGMRRVISGAQDIANQCQFRITPQGADYGNLMNDIVDNTGPTERRAKERNGR